MEISSSSVLSSLQTNGADVNWQIVLDNIITAFGCTAGTLHFLDKESNLLKLQAQQGIPEFLVPKMTVIPIGKGMAGIAAERGKPVEMCNLQTDSSGVARPAAKETKVEGSIAIPMLLNGNLFGTFGIAKPVSYDFKEEEKAVLMKIGEEISQFIQSGTI